MEQPIFRGATRPPLLFGVPITLGFVLFGVCLVGMLWSRRPEFAVAFFIFGFWMRYVTSKDDFYLLQILQRGRTSVKSETSLKRWNGLECHAGLNYKEEQK